MSELTECEIFDCLTANLKLAIEHAEHLATRPKKGAIYDSLRKELALVEGACRQAAYWRSDTRWLRMGLQMAEAHKRAGDWLRGVKMPDGHRVRIPEGVRHPLFLKLADNLRALHKRAGQFKTAKTGRIGTILPDMLAAPIRTSGRPSRVILPDGMAMSQGGIIVPNSVAAQ